MKRQLLTIMLMGASVCAFGADVGVSITVDQPGLYGRIDIGNVPTPAVIYASPVVVAQPPPAVVVPEPLYLHVPPGYAKHWRKHCREYEACGRPVYFVQDQWYNQVYVPARQQYRREHDQRRDDRRDERHEERREKHHGDDHDRGGDHDRGEGHDRGRGHDDR
jgi:hypothetical protein